MAGMFAALVRLLGALGGRVLAVLGRAGGAPDPERWRKEGVRKRAKDWAERG
jgi:hypothetical protein